MMVLLLLVLVLVIVVLEIVLIKVQLNSLKNLSIQKGTLYVRCPLFPSSCHAGPFGAHQSGRDGALVADSGAHLIGAW